MPDPTNDPIFKILDAVYNNGRMADWKVSETKTEDLLPWMTTEQAHQAISNLLIEARIDERKQVSLDYASLTNFTELGFQKIAFNNNDRISELQQQLTTNKSKE